MLCSLYVYFVFLGLKHCKMNIHLLSHLPHYVKRFGPLWTHSAFAFEDSIGYLVKKSHGTHDIAHQVIMNNFTSFTAMASTYQPSSFAGSG